MLYYYHYTCYLLLKSFSPQHLQLVSRWSLIDSKSPQFFWTLLSNLADLSDTVAWMVSTCPLISKSFSPLYQSLGHRSKCTNYDWNHCHLHLQGPNIYSCFILFNYTLWSVPTAKSIIRKVLFLFCWQSQGLVVLLYSHIYLRIHAEYILTQWIKTSENFFKKKYISHFMVRFACERGMETEQRLQHIDLSQHPPDIAVCRSRPPGLLNRRPRGPLRWILFSLPYLVINSSDLQLTDFLSSPSYIIV